MATQYIVLIGDVMQSRSLANRGAVQRKFVRVCAQLNKEGRSLGLVSPLTITLGDEFQAVFDNPARLWLCIFMLEAAMAPLAIRFAIGIGKISTAIIRDTALGMDGPAFYAARTTMEQLKKAGGRYRVGGLKEDEVLLNDALSLVSYNRSKWRSPRIVTFANLLQKKNIKDVSRLTKSSEQAVYRNIRDGALDTVAGLLAGITEKIQNSMR